MKSKPNNLINEKSPYLLQHAYNPVNWFAWNNTTLELAKKYDKPIFLSVGYSTCYWCHVMERESFESPEIASLLNESFINIKVDKEERPDIDRVYMSALQSITGSGGWPMNVFLTPDLKPFYAATYIPPREKFGRSGFEDIILQISDLWKNKKNDLIESSEKIINILKDKISINFSDDTNLDNSIFEKFFEQTKSIYDYEYSGFGSGNKFPRPVVLDLLLNVYTKNQDPQALDIVTHTLKEMFKGGIFDHLEYGFHRYSVDRYWRVPHFEKMLYDQAQIANTYINTYQITKSPFFLEVAEKVLQYTEKNLLSPEGGFFSAEDAESVISKEHPDTKAEGYFYLWEMNELKSILDDTAFKVICFYFGITFEGNTISDPHDVFDNRNVLYIANDVFDTAKKFNLDTAEVIRIIEDSKSKMRHIRFQRIPPSLDTKILTHWNSLMITAYLKAFEVTGNNHYLKISENAIQFLLNNLVSNGSLFHRYIDGDVKVEGMLEDYAFFINMLIKAYEATFELSYLENALKFTNTAIDKFYDEDFGGFFDVASGTKDIIVKTKDIYDGAEPSSNSVMLENLLKLNLFSPLGFFEEKAMKSFELFWEDIFKYPFSYPRMILSFDMYINSIKEIVITGNRNSDTFISLLSEIRNTCIFDRLLIYAESRLENFAPALKPMIQTDEKVFICKNFKCESPVTELENLKQLLKY